MKNFSFLIFLFIFTEADAQYKVRFELTDLSAIKRKQVFISGSFNNWDSSSNGAYRLSNSIPGKWSIELSLPAGSHQYKYSGGTWLSVEKGWDFEEAANREVHVTGDMIIKDTVVDWRDLFISSKHYVIRSSANDTIKLRAHAALATGYTYSPEYYSPDSALYHVKQAMVILDKVKASGTLRHWKGYTPWLLLVQQINGSVLHALGNYTGALKVWLENTRIAEEARDTLTLVRERISIIREYEAMRDFDNVLNFSRKLKALAVRSASGPVFEAGPISEYYIALAHYHLMNTDSALYYASKIYSKGEGNFYEAYGIQLLGDIYFRKKRLDSALFYYKRSLLPAQGNSLLPVTASSMLGIAKVWSEIGKPDSAIRYATASLSYVESNRNRFSAWGENLARHIGEISYFLSQVYKQKNMPDSAHKYLERYVNASDSLNNFDMFRQFQNLTFNENLRQEQLDKQREDERQRMISRVKIYSLIAGLAVLGVLALILWKNNRQKQKVNSQLREQKKEIERTLAELKLTQSQLVQSEKMASLGELTAGIAHEIQNPLNFVNNFSEVNRELLSEMKEEIRQGNFSEVSNLATDIIDNEEKISYHGKRAGAIVKSMLQHSRTSSGKKELTDINALVDEYLRLAFHGLRAKDKSFNAKFESDLDPGIELINIVPQDMGRVILNLINNAFYAVSERKKRNEPGYEPVVSVRTKKLEGNIQIRVKDNGPGIPPDLANKIFQPFFTTKPTGQGTGLGLSLSYDIVKAQGGEMSVKSIPGKETEFTVILPV